MTAQAVKQRRPRCPKCRGALIAEFICYAVDHVHCINCGFHEFIDFKTRKPTMAEINRYAQKGIPKTTRSLNHA